MLLSKMKLSSAKYLMTTDTNLSFSRVAYAEVLVDYDRDQFIREYDDHILPASKPFISINSQWQNMQQWNNIWNVLPQSVFEEYNHLLQQQTHPSSGEKTHQWNMVNLVQVLGNIPSGGGAWWRHQNLNKKKEIKPEFENLLIVRWIKEHLPIQELIGIHCVSIEPNGFSTIHRDNYWQGTATNPAAQNGFYNLGYVVICLNISDGGVPLLWCLDRDETNPPRRANTKAFLTSDYFHHAVPLTTTRRRQIRISFRPTEKLRQILDWSSAVILPKDYAYTC